MADAHQGGGAERCGVGGLAEALERRATDITEDTLREDLLPSGWVDTKVCAIDETWSGLRFNLRKELR